MKRKNKSSARNLTDLEGVVLAFVYRHQPCTPYAIRQSFKKSPTSQFSNSAGSIYPLVRRLAERKYLQLDSTGADGRGSSKYSLSPLGVSKIRAWLDNLENASAIGIYDPIRSRLANLNLLSNHEQILWLKRMIGLLGQQKELITAYETQEFLGQDRLYDIVREGLWAENAQRLRWLNNALTKLQEETHDK